MQVQLPTERYMEKDGMDQTDTRIVECGMLPLVTLDTRTVGISMSVSTMYVGE
jgi:hypothetical protein